MESENMRSNGSGAIFSPKNIDYAENIDSKKVVWGSISLTVVSLISENNLYLNISQAFEYCNLSTRNC